MLKTYNVVDLYADCSKLPGLWTDSVPSQVY